MTESQKHPLVANADAAAMLTTAIRRGMATNEGDPQLAELAAHFVHLAGGARGMAKMMFDAYHSSACSPMQKHRILDSILRAMKFANEQSGPKTELGLASDADLDRELQQVIMKMQE